MIELVRKRSNGVKFTYTIYEPGDIVPVQMRLVRYKDRHHAMKGDYVEDINGRFVPLLRRVCIDKERNHHNMIFPGFCWQPFKQMIFSFPIDKAVLSDVPDGVNGKDIVFAKLLHEGVDPEVAVKKLNPRFSRRQVVNYILRMFANQQFVQHLFADLGYMNKLKKALQDQGLSVEAIADRISEFISDPRANPGLRKWALETALNALETQDKRQPLAELQSMEMDNLDELMAAKLDVKALPAAHIVSEDLPGLSSEA